MQLLTKLSKKNNKLVVGLMSGTSADGIDVALVNIKGSGTKTKIHLIEFDTYSYPKGYKSFLLKNSDASTARLDDISRLNFLIGEFFADAVIALSKKAKVKLSDIDLIGSHGQTIQHLPEKKKLFGKDIRATFQIGDPSVIAKRTGIITIGDFRVADVAVGGTGAPLVPYIDYLLFRSEKKNRGLLNIGGIANITVLPAGCSVDEVFAFDTGPGNMVIDALIQHYFRKSFDTSGKIASKGNVLPKLLHWMMSHKYLQKAPPKSTGRESFGKEFIDGILSKTKPSKKEDVIATVTEYTALTIFDSYMRYIIKNNLIDELIVSGGGVHNEYLMNSLKQYFYGVRFKKIEDFGIPSDAKEAIAFAILANETIIGNPSNMKQATGAKRRTVLGKICAG